MDGTRRGGGLGAALAWAGFALGAPLVAVPGRVARAIGLNDTSGTRALARGVGAAVTGIAALDVLAASRPARREHPTRTARDGSVTVSAGVTVNRAAADAYGLWRDFSRLPLFMTHLESVRPEGETRSHWTARAPGGGTVEWNAEIVDDVPGERLAWRSVAGADVPNSGVVQFTPAPGGRGTEVRVDLTYEQPAGALGTTVARMLGEEPRQQVTDDLRRFKQVLETGEVVRSDGSPEGHRAGRLVAQRPGQPEGRSTDGES